MQSFLALIRNFGVEQIHNLQTAQGVQVSKAGVTDVGCRTTVPTRQIELAESQFLRHSAVVSGRSKG